MKQSCDLACAFAGLVYHVLHDQCGKPEAPLVVLLLGRVLHN
jgi:hypothetical protein